MSQNNNQRSSGSGRSRAKGNSGRSANVSRVSSASNARRKSSKKRGGPDYDFKKIAIGGVILIIAIACITFLVRGMMGGSGKEKETETTTVEETQLAKEVLVDGVTVTGMSREEAKAALEKQYPWALRLTYQEETYEIPNLASAKLEELLNEIYGGSPKDSYTLDFTGQDEAVQAEVAAVAAKWDKKPKNGSISSYDAATDKFLFTGAESGTAVDQEALKTEINKALKDKTFDKTIAVVANQVEPEFSEATAKERYKTIASFTTKTTANSNRNTNVRLSAQAINGTVLQPGEEFSFNKTVGQRTAEKGYKAAAAYNNSEVVDEIGGGICQVSSTLYNTVLRAGLKTTLRRSHTYEPSYVTPGSDATVSWDGPDYKFMNNSSAAIGIRASYSDQTCTVSIYAIPILEEGVTYSLDCKKIKDIDSPAPTYEEDQSLEAGVEKVKSNGTKGSYWETRLVIKKDGEIVSQEIDHSTTYRGHPPVIRRNTTGVVIPTGGETVPESTVESTPAPEGAGDGFISPGTTTSPTQAPSAPGQTGATSGSGSTGPGGNNGPGQTSPQPTTAAPTTGAQPTQAPTTAVPGPGGSDTPIIAPMPGA